MSKLWLQKGTGDFPSDEIAFRFRLRSFPHSGKAMPAQPQEALLCNSKLAHRCLKKRPRICEAFKNPHTWFYS